MTADTLVMMYYPPDTPLAEQLSPRLRDERQSEFVAWLPFLGAFLVAAGVGLCTRDWGDCVIAAVTAYIVLAVAWMVLASVFGWRPLRMTTFLGDLITFIGG